MDNLIRKPLYMGYSSSEIMDIVLPPATDELLPGIRWGCAADLFSPAFWKYQVQAQRMHNAYANHKLGRTLIEEVAVCLLGGFGMPAELGLAAFERLKHNGMLDGRANESELEAQLAIPFLVAGRNRRYRFPRQKAKYLAQALTALCEAELPCSAIALRDFLTELPGIGPKTASWAVRNYLDADDVAILDVHIIRAGIHIGIYDESADPGKNYFHLERRFLEFCIAIDERASQVDAIIWDYMRRLGPLSRLKPSNLEHGSIH